MYPLSAFRAPFTLDGLTVVVLVAVLFFAWLYRMMASACCRPLAPAKNCRFYDAQLTQLLTETAALYDKVDELCTRVGAPSKQAVFYISAGGQKLHTATHCRTLAKAKKIEKLSFGVANFDLVEFLYRAGVVCVLCGDSPCCSPEE
ncbi:hypothetical protein ElyMa_002531200 [Elysia marginata]|uniref:Uncharacterized protein n=1 Tax=Elysia marginata TaxID=1093978 RepID=A0AAV4GT57_9GAST|nr:hypothetical protein ElyMa_002531200 [Elysia marginata]